MSKINSIEDLKALPIGTTVRDYLGNTHLRVTDDQWINLEYNITSAGENLINLASLFFGTQDADGIRLSGDDLRRMDPGTVFYGDHGIEFIMTDPGVFACFFDHDEVFVRDPFIPEEVAH